MLHDTHVIDIAEGAIAQDVTAPSENWERKCIEPQVAQLFDPVLDDVPIVKEVEISSTDHVLHDQELLLQNLQSQLSAQEKELQQLRFEKQQVDIAKEAHLSLKSFVRQKQHLIAEKAREWRLERCGKFLICLKHNRSMVKILSDKKIFTVDQYHNYHND